MDDDTSVVAQQLVIDGTFGDFPSQPTTDNHTPTAPLQQEGTGPLDVSYQVRRAFFV